jgi:APA family basic amino acid/polyamine antiporter
LHRLLGLPGAVGLGLGSILGTGVFVSLALVAEISGALLLPAILLAALLALFNALASAELAAAHPVSGGAYEYGHVWLNPSLGFVAGWVFLLAKSASAATAALGVSAYLRHLNGGDADGLAVPLAVLTSIGVTALVISGLRRSNAVNMVIVSLTALALIALIAASLLSESQAGIGIPSADPGLDWRLLASATALMFVAYTGYGRVATLAEEVRNPARVIPLAILLTLAISAALYIGVGWAVVQASEAGLVLDAAGGAPLEAVARALERPGLATLVAVGALTAMLGVLLNLVLGLSRIVLAMGRRGDLPSTFAHVDARGVPSPAVLLVGSGITALVLIGDIRLAWTFSAFTVLIYYAISNLAALRLSRAQRLYPPIVPALGLAGCVFLAFQVPWPVWATGLALIVGALALRAVLSRPRPRHLP